MTSQGLVFPVLKVVKLDVYFLELSCPFLGFQVLSAMRSGNREGERDTTFSLCILLPSCTNLSGKPDNVAHVTPFAKTDHSNTASTKLTENYGKLGACRCTGSYVQILPVPFLWDFQIAALTGPPGADRVVASTRMPEFYWWYLVLLSCSSIMSDMDWRGLFEPICVLLVQSIGHGFPLVSIGFHIGRGSRASCSETSLRWKKQEKLQYQ